VDIDICSAALAKPRKAQIRLASAERAKAKKYLFTVGLEALCQQ
jgi:hypothetical protein